MTVQTATEFEKLLSEPYKRWYQFGLGSPGILYGRLRNKHQPIFHAHMMWQRSQRGWSVEDTWGLHWHLERVIIGAIERWLEQPPTGHPTTGTFDPETGQYRGETLTYEDWLRILGEIVTGMKASQAYSEYYEWPKGGEEAFNLAMDHLKNHWHDLWD